MTTRTYRYFTCLRGHTGVEKTSENDQPYSQSWETVALNGLVAAGKDERGLAAYTCQLCGQPMSLNPSKS